MILVTKDLMKFIERNSDLLVSLNYDFNSNLLHQLTLLKHSATTNNNIQILILDNLIFKVNGEHTTKIKKKIFFYKTFS